MYNRYWQDGTNTCTFEYHYQAEQNYRCLTWQLMQNPQVGIIWWVSSRKVSFDLLMEDRKTGWTVSDSVQETKRAGKAEQESTNKGDFFYSFLSQQILLWSHPNLCQIANVVRKQKINLITAFPAIANMEQEEERYFFYQNWHHCHHRNHHHCKYGQGWGVFLIFTSSQTL